MVPRRTITWSPDMSPFVLAHLRVDYTEAISIAGGRVDDHQADHHNSFCYSWTSHHIRTSVSVYTIPHAHPAASDSHPPSMTIATNVKNGL
ncbi:hypothetical protein BLNAU_6687 [Blattamonas nauphoetae]|uniref:Uncharacterized protein n=1 Tax=Blattamonas nauphoetae TaxID=2049346 RepID=A0ABQ9Y3T5_9EUKA|nr:hypothetical protein BLNAU_6687 [Blattamonas nauphoetae]